MAKDYYKTLGVDKKASKDDIKKAFHKLAHKYHPDKQGGDEAKFKEINEAYQILSDDNKRAQYDQFGEAGVGGGNPFGGAQSGQGAGFGGFDFDFSNFRNAQGGEGFEFNLNDILGDLFSGQSGRRTGGRRSQKRGRDISVDAQISFKEAIFGAEREIRLNKTSQCETCRGTGAEPGSKMKKCPTCDGKGQVKETRRSIFGVFQSTSECSTCLGRGEAPERKCRTCAGAGVLDKQESIKIVIPPGLDNGEMIRLSGHGEAVTGGQTGDLYVKIHVERDPNYKRAGNDLTTDLKIKLKDALLGSEQHLETLDGPLTLKIPAGIAYGEILRVKGKGVPMGHQSSRRGDLLIRVVFPTPNKLSRQAKKIIEDLRAEGF